jgi:pSer/pThr/pTyr-binding forkhead associated (FHA) protein
MQYEGFLGPGAFVHICARLDDRQLEERGWKRYSSSLLKSPELVVWNRSNRTITLRSPSKGIDYVEVPVDRVISIQLTRDPTGIATKDRVKVIVTHVVDIGKEPRREFEGEVIDNNDSTITIVTKVDGDDIVIEFSKSNVDVVIKL